MANTQEIFVPDIGDYSDVEIIEVLVGPGDAVAAEDSLITLESDKASMEVPSPVAGTVKELKVQIGDRVSAGSLVLLLETDSGDVAVDETVLNADGSASHVSSTPGGAAPGGAAPTASGGELLVSVPDIGDYSDVEVIEMLVGPGDTVAAEDSLITLESDKASMEVPSPAAGTVKEMRVQLGDHVSQGSPVLLLTLSAAAAESAPAPAAQAASPPAQAPAASPSATPAATPPKPAAPASPTAHLSDEAQKKAHASPAVRRFARELGADLSLIQGSGRKGRILKSDVKSFIKDALSGTGVVRGGGGLPAGQTGIPPIPQVDFSKFGEIERIEMGRIPKLSAANLHRSWLNLPMVTHHDEADITAMEDFRKSLKAEAEKQGVRVTGLAFHMKALAACLRAFPKFNSSLSSDGEALIYKKYCHIGIAVDTPNGLVVPVFRDVDKKSIYQLSAEMADLSTRARAKKLKADEMQGACMTISSLGGIGGTHFSPIVNAPEVAILGITRARMQPVWDGGDFVPRLMCPLDLTYDHRVIDGADAARFLAHYCQIAGDIRRLLL